MNFAAFILALSSISAQLAFGWQAVPEHRQLNNNKRYAYLVSHISNKKDWCITALHGDEIGFKPCDYKTAPSNQLWLYDGKKFVSKANSNRCMTVNYGHRLGVGVHVRMADCDMKTDLNQFDHNGGTDKIRIHKDSDLCVSNRGNNANEGDPVGVLKCKSEDKFTFTYKLADEPDEPDEQYSGLVNDDAYPKSGCLVVKGETPKKKQPLILGNCELNHSWRYDDDGLFHSELDDDMCMQAGRVGTKPHAGTKMILYPCDKNNKLQKFKYNGIDIKYHYHDDLCVGYRGDTSNVDSDPIILKDCDKDGNNWSEDS